MYAQLGSIPFELIMVTGLASRQTYSYAEHQVIEGKPQLQYIGDGLDETTLTIRFHVEFCSPRAELDRLRDEAAKHRALPFILANGTHKGRYVITDIDVTVEITADDGTLMSVDVRVALKEWVDADPLAAQQQAQKQAAGGLLSPGPVARVAAAPGNLSAQVSGGIVDGAAQISRSATRIGALSTQVAAADPESGSALSDAAGGIKSSAASLMQLAQRGQSATSQIQGYTREITGYSSAITRITSGLPGPLGRISRSIAGANRQISDQSTRIMTLSQLGGSGANETSVRAGMIVRMLPK